MNQPIDSKDQGEPGVEQVWRTLPAQRPSAFQSSRMERALDAALLQDRRARIGDRPTWMVVAATGFCGIAFGAWAMHSEWSPWQPPPAPTIAVTAPVSLPVHAIAPPPAREPTTAPTVTMPARPVRVAKVAPVVELPVAEPDDVVAVSLSLVSSEDVPAASAAANQLVAVARRDEGSAERILEGISHASGLEASRVLCQVHLLSRRNEESIRVCRSFVDDHPSEQHVFGILLAVAALGEELNRWNAADAALSDAWSWSLQHGLPTAELAFRRAHARIQLDRVDDARADLRAGIVDQGSRPLPASAKALAKRLGVQLPN
jgi:hypothetical protein